MLISSNQYRVRLSNLCYQLYQQHDYLQSMLQLLLLMQDEEAIALRDSFAKMLQDNHYQIQSIQGILNSDLY